jgi:hypothetical protein
MFRDMSGLAQSAALAQAALQASAQGATAAGTQVAQTLSTVMANNTERMRIAAAIATGGASGLAGGGEAMGGRPAKNITEEGARINQARDMDERGVGGSGAAAGGTAGAGSDAGETMDMPSDAQDGTPMGSSDNEGRVFDRMTGGPGASAFEKALAFGGIDAELAGGKKGGGGVVSGKSSAPKSCSFSFEVVPNTSIVPPDFVNRGPFTLTGGRFKFTIDEQVKGKRKPRRVASYERPIGSSSLDFSSTTSGGNLTITITVSPPGPQPNFTIPELSSTITSDLLRPTKRQDAKCVISVTADVLLTKYTFHAAPNQTFDEYCAAEDLAANQIAFVSAERPQPDGSTLFDALVWQGVRLDGTISLPGESL